MQFTKSEQLHAEALEHIIGGVDSPSRSYKAVGGGALLQWRRQAELISGTLMEINILTI